VGDAIQSCATAPLKRAGKSVQRIAYRLNRLEEDLVRMARTADKAYVHKLVGGEKGGLSSRLLKDTLAAVTQYKVRVGGFNGSLDMARLAWACSRGRLSKHENELE